MVVVPAHLLARRVLDAWGNNTRLFIDACYSRNNCPDSSAVDFDGHPDSPLYECAIDRIVVWVEQQILVESAHSLMGL